MSRPNMKNVYEERIRQIELDKAKAIRTKKWGEWAKLEAEKARIEKLV